MMENQEHKKDRAITDKDEQALFHFQIGKQLIEKRAGTPDQLPSDPEAIRLLDEIIPLLEEFTKESDADKKDILHVKLEPLEQKFEEVYNRLLDEGATRALGKGGF